MKRITIVEYPADMRHLLELAQENPVLIVTPDGKEFVIALADDFEQEVAQLRESMAFQQFLDERSSQNRPRRSIEEIAQAINRELAAQAPADT